MFGVVLLRLVKGCSWDVAGRLGKGGETTLRTRYNEWNAHGAFDALMAEAIEGYDRIVGAYLSEASVLAHARDNHAFRTWAASPRPSSEMDCSRILYFWILPVMVMGKASVNLMWRGTL